VIVATLAQVAITHASALEIGARVAVAAADPTGTATTSTNVDTDTDTESKKSGPIGLVLIIVLCVACYFLFKSMSKRLRAVREGQVPISAPPATPPAATSAPSESLPVNTDGRTESEPPPSPTP
jgi:hypothetical protein